MAILPEDIRHRRQFDPTPVITIPANEKISAPKFKRRLLSRFYVRLHMTLMLCAVILSGVGANKLLLELDVIWMFIRYPIAVCVAYGIFFLSIKVWLWYVGFGPRSNDDTDNEALSDLKNELADCSSGETGSYDPGWSSSETGSAAESWGNSHYEGGSTSSYSSSSTSEGSSFDFASGFDLGDEAGFVVIILLALLGLLLFGVFGVGIYLIYQSPVILAEAALQAALSLGLINAARRIEYGDWAGSVFKATWIPFAAVLALAVGFGWAAQHFCPAATKAAEIFYLCR